MPLSYEATVLSKTPIAFYRLDETSGTVITDLSGNGYDGEYFSVAVKGQASPIETDPASYAVSDRVGLAPAPAPVNAFSWGGWGYYDSTNPGGSTIVSRNGQFGLPGSNMVNIDHGNGIITARINIDANPFVFYDLSYALGANTGWYRVLVTRSTNVMRLYVNGFLRDQRTDLAVGPMTNAAYLSGGGFGWKLGCSGDSGNLAGGVATDEIDLYDYALTAGDELEIYESALNRLLTSATIKVLVQVILDTDAPEPIDFPFAHNWADPISGSERVITEHLSWKTHANQSEPDYQQRVNARPHGPRRALEYAVTPTSALAKAAFQRTLWQPAQVFRLPIWTDWVGLDATANVSDVTLSCDTTLRDFEIGSYCTLATDPYDPATFQSFKITSRTDSQLGITPAVTTTVTNGLVAPVRLACLPAEEAQMEAYVIDRETGVLTFEVLDMEVSSRRVTTYTPATTYQPNGAKPAVEVFSLDSARFDVLEPTPYAIRQRQLGTGALTGNDYYRGLDTATASTIPARVLLGTRQALSEFYGWLQARQGRQNPVWIPSRENDLTFIRGISGTIQRIVAGYSFYNLHYGRRDIQITYADGTVANRRITTVVDNNDGTEDITLNASINANVAKISWLKFCVAPDSFELRFHRDLSTPGGVIVECAWEFSELLTTP